MYWLLSAKLCNYIPVDTRLCFNVYKRRIDVETTSCVYRDSISKINRQNNFWESCSKFLLNPNSPTPLYIYIIYILYIIYYIIYILYIIYIHIYIYIYKPFWHFTKTWLRNKIANEHLPTKVKWFPCWFVRVCEVLSMFVINVVELQQMLHVTQQCFSMKFLINIEFEFYIYLYWNKYFIIFFKYSVF